MEACLEIYGFYRPIIKRTIVGMLCVAILTGAVFSRKAVGTKEYLSAEKQEETRNDIAVSKMEKIVTAESQEIIVSEPDKTVMAEAKDNLAEKEEAIIAAESKVNIVDVPKNIIVDGTKDIIMDTPKNTVVDEAKDVITDEPKDTIVDEAKDVITDEPKDTIVNESNDIPKNDTEESEDAKTDIAETATPFLIDEAGMLYGINEEMLDCRSGVLELPSENCVGIRSHAFINGFTDIYEIYIPSNISVIETGAFDGIDNLFDIMVEEGNINYTSIDGVLYDEEEITLLAFPAGRTGGYIVPTQTERIAANAFAQTGLSVIDIRDCGTLLIEDDRAAQLVRCEQ
ncbi:leucine-rich repeat domain-containing protein [Mediterraneibacter sp. NSJ-151]|uniref:leucine-rich repeat domain-containing protein n=1 Tax=Mediterraneibacter sp. NSJ-151 TaxID=2897708 RepID=UPI001F0B4536|nr:leucine-rich repeat domain-containing protein [Mediterraneibacter sp. NSJ-151]MCH4281011.1 leucine-rich repeat domain-containing protein [Mediterraneibacter sp. NSJ-151]